MRIWAWSTTLLCLLFGGLFAWRAVAFQAAVASWEEASKALETHVTTLETSLASATREKGQLEAGNLDLETTLQSLRDRLSNLEAQRDHLRAEIDKGVRRTADLREANTRLVEELGQARTELLSAREAPARLETALDLARQRIESLESQLDLQSRNGAGAPEALTYEGASSDALAFALSGNARELGSLPMEVVVCRRGQVALTGWIHRSEGDILHGHAKAWHQPPSTLVKGEKVFIFSKHETKSDL